MSFLKELAAALEISEFDIHRILSTAPRRYKVYTIPKRSGRGSRIIAQPARELKLVQRYIINSVLNELPVHRAAMAYVEGKSIRDNAIAHVQNRVIMKLDFTDFFPSLAYRDLERVLDVHGFSRVDRSEWRVFNNLLFWDNPFNQKRCLSIGAPSSPLVSNLIMEGLDEQFAAIGHAAGVAYTRYADDITLSAGDVEAVLSVEAEIKRIVRRTRSPKLTFNNSKRGVFTMAGRRLVTGLVITPDKRVSLGRGKKREISAAVHHVSTGKNVTPRHIAKTKGWLAYAKSVEPVFFRALISKYGNTIANILQSPNVTRASIEDSFDFDL